VRLSFFNQGQGQEEVRVFIKSLKVINRAEEEARKTIQLAQDNANEVIKAAHQVGKDTIASTVARAEYEINHLTQTMDHKVTEEAMELASTIANRQATLRARAERRLEAASMIIVERIVNV